jgi:hypothetical protein
MNERLAQLQFFSSSGITAASDWIFQGMAQASDDAGSRRFWKPALDWEYALRA